MRPRPIIVVWLFALTAVAFFVVGSVAYYGRRADGGAVDFVCGAVLLVVAVFVLRFFCKR